MSPARKLEIAAQFYFSSRALKARALQQQHPDWPEDRIRQGVKKYSFMHPIDFDLDIRGMLAVSGDRLDTSFLQKQLTQLKLNDEWSKVNELPL